MAEESTSMDGPSQTRLLDRRRLAEAWYKWSVWRWRQQISGTALTIVEMDLTSQNLDMTIEKTLPDIRLWFTQKWSGPYHRGRCHHPKCSASSSTDGHMKARRSVCDARHEGVIETVELGSVTVGCPRTPISGSFYCAVHHSVSALTSKTGKEEATTAALADGCDDDGIQTRSKIKAAESLRYVVKSLKQKKVTHKGTMFLVEWYHTPDSEWVSAEKISPKLQQEFEKSQRDKRAEVRESQKEFVMSENEKREMDKLSCKTVKEYQYGQRKHRTAGICATVYNCGIIYGFSELFGSESLSQIYCILLWLQANAECFPSNLAYDDGCHLYKFVRNVDRASTTKEARQLADLNIVVDRMHFRNHVDKWCKLHMNPDKNKEFKDINTEVCEQTFFWLSRFSHAVRHMNYARFNLFMFTICDMFNEGKLKRKY